MANKYLDVSATYNGDGTLSTPAASDGAAGAWNSFLEVATKSPTYGSVNDGDDIYVRTNDGTSDLDYTISATTLTIPSGSSVDAPTRFIFDDGTVWANSGTFTVFLSNSLSSIIVVGNYNELVGNFHLNHLYAGSSGSVSNTFVFKVCTLRGGMITNGVQTSGARGSKIGVDSGGSPPGFCTMIGTYIYCGNAYSDTSYLPFNTSGNGAGLKLIGCTFDVSAGRTGHALFAFGRYGTSLTIEGGSFVGLTPSHKLYLVSQGDYAYNYNVEVDGVDLGAVTPETFVRNAYSYDVSSTINAAAGGQRVVCNNVNGSFNYSVFNGQTYETWSSGQNYPTLNAVLPDGTPWSIRVMPAICHRALPAKILGINKLFVGTPAAKTLTFELAIHENYGSVTKKDFYVEVAYFDNATGALVFQSSEADSGNLEASSAAWSPNPPVYGADSYNRFKIALTTNTAIKQYSMIRATIVSTKTPQFNTDYYFIDPEFTVS